jgi:molybdopterin/thiamine biosynthesis adenylyltransferase
MMPAELRLTDQQWQQLQAGLLSDDNEHAALLVCGYLATGDDQVLLCRRVVPLGPDDLLHAGRRHLALAPTTLARVAKAARAEQGTVVVCHSHPFPGPVHASPLDLDTEAELCGRALWGRLAPRPVAALVLGPDGLDGRLWRNGAARPLDRVRVAGDHIRLLPPPPEVQIGDQVARQVLAWGEGGQRRLATAQVAVVGVGGTGSQVTVQLAHLGVGGLILVDPDRVEASNLSRLDGAVPGDIGRPKVQVLADAARAINPSAAVQAVPASVLDIDPALLGIADVVVCATDGHGSRALLTELAQQYLVPVVDLGVEVVPDARGLRAGGGVRVLRPGGWCLHCAGTLDAGLVREEYLDHQERARELERGYLRGANVPAPAVISLNGVVASLAALEVCQLLVGFLGSSGGRLLYRAEARALTTASVTRHPACYVCGHDGLLGLGDARRLPTRFQDRSVG